MDEEYFDNALCRIKKMPTADFFEAFEDMTTQDKLKIIATCSQCNVREICEAKGHAMKDAYGVWGGKFFKKGKVVRITGIRKSRALQTID